MDPQAEDVGVSSRTDLAQEAGRAESSGSAPAEPEGPFREAQMPPVECSGVFYTIQPGDTFFTIAQRFGVRVQALVDANPQIEDPARIFPGQVICVPTGAACPPGVEGTTYTVQAGDTLNAIARRFGVTVQAILNANPQITDPNLIFIGQRICIPRAPAVGFPCCLILSPEETPPMVLTRGTALIQPTDDGRWALTFAAVGLPEPSTLGDFDAYIGSIRIGEFLFSGELARILGEDQPVMWAGTRVIPDNPSSPDNFVTVRAVNLAQGTFGPIILSGMVRDCRGPA